MGGFLYSVTVLWALGQVLSHGLHGTAASGSKSLFLLHPCLIVGVPRDSNMKLHLALGDSWSIFSIYFFFALPPPPFPSPLPYGWKQYPMHICFLKILTCWWSACPACLTLAWTATLHNSGVVAHTCNPSLQELEAEDLVQGQSGVQEIKTQK